MKLYIAIFDKDRSDDKTVLPIDGNFRAYWTREDCEKSAIEASIDAVGSKVLILEIDAHVLTSILTKPRSTRPDCKRFR